MKRNHEEPQAEQYPLQLSWRAQEFIPKDGHATILCCPKGQVHARFFQLTECSHSLAKSGSIRR
jgi:hypothetical protein